MQAWLLQECEHAEYSLGVRARLRAVHQVQTFTYSLCIALGVFELRQFKHNEIIGLWRAFRCSGSRSVKGKLLLQIDSDFRLCRSSFCSCDSSWRRCIGWFLHEYRVWTCLTNFPYHANTLQILNAPFSIHFPSIFHPFSIHLSLFSIHFPVPVKLDRWGLRPPPAAALGDLVLLRRGADALSGGSGREPWPSTEKGTFSFLFFKREQCYRYIYNYIYIYT